MFHLQFPDISLSSAALAVRLAEQALVALDREEDVFVDLGRVQRMTPSFSNAFIMTVFAQASRDVLRERLIFTNAAPHVAAALNRSIARFDSGIRLSTQRPLSA